MNQRWDYRLNETQLFVRLFGSGAGNPGQAALLDTDLDILCHFFACASATLILYAALKYRTQRKPEQEMIVFTFSTTKRPTVRRNTETVDALSDKGTKFDV